MSMNKATFAVIGVLALGALALGVSSPSSTPVGSWQVDTRHSDAQLITDGTTDFGKQKINFTLGYGRVNGTLKLDDNDPTKSSVELHIYPATSMAPSIEEKSGSFKTRWLANLANQTLMCFHSKKVVRLPDGKIETTGDLTLTRVDRNVEANPNEAYSGPVYGPPIIHHLTRPATFDLDISAAGATGQQVGATQASGSTTMNREAFPQMLKAVLTTYWPPLVQEEKCQAPANVSEDYRGAECTGTFMMSPGLPAAPTTVGEDYPGASNYSAVVGSQLTILLHLQLAPQASGGQAPAGN